MTVSILEDEGRHVRENEISSLANEIKLQQAHMEVMAELQNHTIRTYLQKFCSREVHIGTRSWLFAAPGFFNLNTKYLMDSGSNLQRSQKVPPRVNHKYRTVPCVRRTRE